MDHETFHGLEIDGLYEELDGPGATALNAHAATCEACGARYERLRRARQRGLAALGERVSDDFESRVMAAVDAALASRASQLPSNVVPFVPFAPRAGVMNETSPRDVAPAPAPPGKVVPIFARPWFAAAASLFLILGAATILSQFTMRASSPVAAADRAPTVVPAGQVGAATDEAPAIAATTTAAASMAAMDTPPITLAAAPPQEQTAASGPLALAEPRYRSISPAAPPPPPAVAKAQAYSDDSLAGAAGASAGGKSAPDPTPGLAAAKALYAAGRYRDAKPKFDALASQSPEAELYAARCVAQISGCTAATPRFDALIAKYPGSPVAQSAQAAEDNCNAPQAAAPAATAGHGAAAPAMHAKPSPRHPAPPAATLDSQ